MAEMNVDHVLQTMNGHQVQYILIGGMNYLLRHQPVLTYDIDLWINDSEANLSKCEGALSVLEAEWGATEADWKPVAELSSGWLQCQMVYCLTSPHGAIDIFRNVSGLEQWEACRTRAVEEKTAGGIAYVGLSDSDMLSCQLALDESQRKQERIDRLRAVLEKPPTDQERTDGDS